MWGIEHAGVWRELREMEKDYLHERIRERWGSMSADKRAAGGHDYVLKNEYGQDVLPCGV